MADWLQAEQAFNAGRKDKVVEQLEAPVKRESFHAKLRGPAQSLLFARDPCGRDRARRPHGRKLPSTPQPETPSKMIAQGLIEFGVTMSGRVHIDARCLSR